MKRRIERGEISINYCDSSLILNQKQSNDRSKIELDALTPIQSNRARKRDRLSPISPEVKLNSPVQCRARSAPPNCETPRQERQPDGRRNRKLRKWIDLNAINESQEQEKKEKRENDSSTGVSVGESHDSLSESSQEEYCVCKGPDDGSWMVECSKCFGWFHGDCVGIEEDQVEDRSIFICPHCSQTNTAQVWNGDQIILQGKLQKLQKLEKLEKLEKSNQNDNCESDHNLTASPTKEEQEIVLIKTVPMHSLDTFKAKQRENTHDSRFQPSSGLSHSKSGQSGNLSTSFLPGTPNRLTGSSTENTPTTWNSSPGPSLLRRGRKNHKSKNPRKLVLASVETASHNDNKEKAMTTEPQEKHVCTNDTPNENNLENKDLAAKITHGPTFTEREIQRQTSGIDDSSISMGSSKTKGTHTVHVSC